MMKSQSSLGLDSVENTLRSIVRESDAYVIIRNGHCDFELSNIPDGVNVMGESKEKELAATILANKFEYVAKDGQIDGLLIECTSSIRLDEPLYVIFLDNSQIEQGRIYHNFYLLREGVRVNIIEKKLSDLGRAKKQNLNMFSSWFLENESALTYYGYELPNKSPYYSINNCVVIRQMGNSSCSFFTFYWEGGVTNNELEVFLDGEFAACKLYSVSLLLNSTIVNHKIRMNHNFPNCESCQLYKGVFNDNSSSHFDSIVYVNKHAQKTSSTQQNNNIILSDYASVKSDPQLEIFADDVKCAHGSTVGQVDPKALFYLQSRGIGKKDGTALLLQGFLCDVIDEIVDLKLREFTLNEFYKILSINHYYE
ncbi:MAG: hypothetical protein CMP62_00470 [Flavobacteriales bacterium]|nr:hypothetical protein [Flavobacteriales bacterium]